MVNIKTPEIRGENNNKCMRHSLHNSENIINYEKPEGGRREV